MKEVTKRMIKVIHESTGIDFETKYNEAMNELSRYNPEVEFNNNQGFCAYLIYTVHEKIPETLEDRCELAGIRYTCSDCPHLERTPDKRLKHFPCMYAKRGEAFIDSPACRKLYNEKADAGEIPKSLIDIPEGDE